MRLALTVAGHDVEVEVGDPAASVGELFEACRGEQAARVASGVRVLDAATPLSASGLRPGDALHAAADQASGAVRPDVVVAVTAGVDAGRTVALPPGELRIGRGSDNGLRLASNGVSKHHCTIRRDADGGLWARDEGSINGTVLSGQPLGQEWTALAPGVPLQCGPTVVEVRTLPADDAPRSVRRALAALPSGPVPYYRSPADRVVDPDEQIPLPVPPARPRRMHLPVLGMLAPLAVGGAMVAITGQVLYALFVLMSPAMMLLTWLERGVRGGRRKRRSARRYRAELRDFAVELADARDAEARRRRARWPDPAEVVRRASDLSVRLWERRGDHPEFMSLAVGLADQAWDPPAPPGSDDAPDVDDALRAAGTLTLAPLVIGLHPGTVVGLAGLRHAAMATARALCLQAAALHGPAELRIAVVTAASRAGEWEWTKWLPHLQPATAHGQILALCPDSSLAASDAELDELVADAGANALLLVVVDTSDLADHGDGAVRRLLRNRPAGSAGIVVAPGVDGLPDACQVVVDHHDVEGEATLRRPLEARSIGCIASGVGERHAERVARDLARVHDPDVRGGSAVLPAVVGLGDTLGLVDARGEQVARRWSEASGLRAVFGVGLGGVARVDLDRGPHLVVAGGRGAGKTEALTTLVLSLAASVPPEEMTLVLWGESFARFQRLPHVASVVSRDDEDAVRRVVDGLEREITRRERDRATPASERQPALVVAVDDVDTIIRQVPKAADDLIRVLRRGRGLGVHVMWSTSRANGALITELVDLSPLRVLLRVASSTESTELLGSDAAFRLERSLAGRGFLLAGRGEPREVQVAATSIPAPRPKTRLAITPFSLASARAAAVGATGGVPDEGHVVAAIAAAGAAHARPADLLSPAAALMETLRSPGLPELLGIDDPMQIDPAQLWAGRGEDTLLRVPIGVDAELRPVEVDLKESALGGMGPHGLLVGATGSGKSELLRTLVTALAATHSPDLLSFVLVDFKGGANFASLARLPHVAGLVTNLAGDLAMVDRVLAALGGEQRRRQEVLASAGNLASVREYRAWRETLPPEQRPEPLPELLIVVDEFAELLDQQPEFIAFFLTIGRVGRSLGIHLLLGSQRLEEGKLRGLDTHLSYRLCLRTFSAAESRTVLGVPDAYTLPSAPGSGYLKVGTESFERFQAAYVSGAYEPAGDGASVMSVMADRLVPAAPPAHQIWLPPLPPALALDRAFPSGFVHDARRGFAAAGWPGTGGLIVPLGWLDEPELQRQVPFVVDFAGAGGNLVVVGAPQTGKSCFARSAVLSLAVTHTPDELQCYIVDMGGGTLDGLRSLPHVGTVASRLEGHLVRRLVNHVDQILLRRERQFRELGIDSVGTFRARRAAGELPAGEAADVLLVIDGWAAFRSQHEALEPVVADLAARGLGHGLHVLLTANRWTEVRPVVLESFGGRVELRANNPADSAFDRRRAATIRADQPGRGLTPAKQFFQVALPRLDGQATEEHLREATIMAAEHVASRWAGQQAPSVRLLPLRVTPADLPPSASDDPPGVALGVLEDGLLPWRLDLGGAEPHFLVLGDGEAGKTTVLRSLAGALVEQCEPERAQLVVVDYRRTLLEAVPDSHLHGYAPSEPAARSIVGDVAALLEARLPGPDVTPAQLRDRSWWTGPDFYVLVDDYDLVVTATGSPLSPLVPYLAQGRDLGLHVVIARRIMGLSKAMFEPVIGRIREVSPAGLVLAGDRNEGPLLGGVRAGEQPPGRGYVVSRRSPPCLVQVVDAAMAPA